MHKTHEFSVLSLVMNFEFPSALNLQKSTPSFLYAFDSGIAPSGAWTAVSIAEIRQSSVTTVFGHSGNLSPVSGSYLEIENSGFSTIAFHITPPNNGWTQYQGSFDNVNFSPITFRQVGNDGYTQESAVSEDYIGSIVGCSKIRFVNMTGALVSGTVMGTLSKQLSIIEGIEHSSPPHKFGNTLFHIGFSITGGSVNNSGLYFPTARHKFVITYLNMSASSQNGSYITFHEGSGTQDNPEKWVLSTYMKGAANDTQNINGNFTTPYVADGITSGLYLTTTANALVRGVIHGYEAEN